MLVKILIILLLAYGTSSSSSSSYQVVTHILEIPEYSLEFHGNNRSSRILNGNSAGAGQFPFSAYLITLRSGTTSICTGSLIGSNWILSARTCFVNTANNPANSLQAFLGSTDNQSPQLISSFANWAGWITETNGNHPNIIIFRLTQNMPTTQFIRAIRLPRLIEEHFGFEAFNITTVGWGRLANGVFPRVLQQASFRILGVHLCFWNPSFSVHDFCSQHPTLVSMVAEGDTGGGSIIVEGDGQQTLIGITSRTLSMPNGPAAISVRVSSFLRFINEQTGIPFR